jgi:phosphotransferase system HPr-like phosphotransfer protein
MSDGAPGLNARPATAALYKQLVVLDRAQHRGRRVLPVRDHAGVRHMNAVFCAAAEFAEACKHFPLLFIQAPDTGMDAARSSITPVCLLGLQGGENLFVDAQGAWTGAYLPAFIRRYPFALVRTGEGDATLAVAVDADYPGLVQGDDPRAKDAEPLFGDDGEPTPHLQSVMRFLMDYDQAVHLTRPIGDRLNELNLLKPMRAQGQLPGGQSFSVDGFWVVDEARLNGLPDKAVLALHREGLLALIHAHLVSLSNLNRVVERRAARSAAA